VLVKSEDLVGGPGIQNGQAGAVEGDLVELVGKAPPRPLAAQTSKPVPERLRDRLGLGLARQFGQGFSELLGFGVPDVQCHEFPPPQAGSYTVTSGSTQRQRPLYGRGRLARRVSAQLGEAAVDRMAVLLRRLVAGAAEKSGLHPSISGGVELGGDVAQEEDLAGREAEGFGDGGVGGGGLLWAGRGVVEAFEVREEVALVAVAEEELLGEDAARGEDPGPDAVLLPGPQGFGHVGPDLAFELSRAVAVFPEDALEHLEAGRLAVAVHEPVGVGGSVSKIRDRLLLPGMFLAQPVQSFGEAWLPGGAGGVEAPPGVGEEDVQHEGEGSRGPFDVGQDGAGARGKGHPAQIPGAGM